jgi:alkylation response protein AidB-like acyl-CoA dehydrogenase
MKGAMTDDLFADALKQLLAAQCTPQGVRDIEAGQSPAALWAQIEQSGFANALVDETQGGAGLSLLAVCPLFELCGSFALPVPLAETMSRGLCWRGRGLKSRRAASALAALFLATMARWFVAPCVAARWRIGCLLQRRAAIRLRIKAGHAFCCQPVRRKNRPPCFVWTPAWNGRTMP